ncbi:Hypothetical protein D9617_1g082870 [Elsinoe fawcettii]|nr:Hypothetical protein D9617_1g082870 [Elsinoe fawcettii]
MANGFYNPHYTTSSVGGQQIATKIHEEQLEPGGSKVLQQLDFSSFDSSDFDHDSFKQPFPYVTHSTSASDTHHASRDDSMEASIETALPAASYAVDHTPDLRCKQSELYRDGNGLTHASATCSGPAGWPTTPTNIGHPSKLHRLVFALDVLITIIPVLFLTLALAAYQLDGVPVANSRSGAIVEQATTLGPTIFPLLFAAIVAPSLKVFARYVSERSSQKLGLLELLVGCRTVLSTLECQLLLGRLTATGVCLLLLWILSPLGGQASLRLLHLGEALTNIERPMLYLDTTSDRLYRRSVFENDFNAVYRHTRLASIFSSSLLASKATKNAPQDLWGNVKIPRVSSLRDTAVGPGGWYSVPNNLSMEEYTSLVGIPIVRQVAEPRSTSEFDLMYSYVEFAQSGTSSGPQGEAWWPPMLGFPWTSVNSTALTADDNWWSIFGNNFSPHNTYTSDIKHKSFFLSYTTEESDYRFTLEPEATVTQTEYKQRRSHNLTFVTRFRLPDRPVPQLFLQNFTLHRQDVEVKVKCIVATCEAISIRPQQSQQPESDNTHNVAVDSIMMEGLVRSLPLIFGGTEPEFELSDSQATAVWDSIWYDVWDAPANISVDFDLYNAYNSTLEMFLRGSDSPASGTKSAQDLPWLPDVPVTQISRRLGLLANTHFQLSLDPEVTVIGDTPAVGDPIWHSRLYTTLNSVETVNEADEIWSGSTPEYMDMLLSNQKPPPFNPVNGTETYTTSMPVYRRNVIWIIILIFSSSVLIIINITSIILRFKIRAPDILGYVSTLTYDNPYIPITPASTIDGMERSKLLYDMKVRIGDVQCHEDVGHITLAVDTDNLVVGPLKKGRLYQ